MSARDTAENDAPPWLRPGPLPAESAEHNHPQIQYCNQQCPAYTARPAGFPTRPIPPGVSE